MLKYFFVLMYFHISCTLVNISCGQLDSGLTQVTHHHQTQLCTTVEPLSVTDTLGLNF